MAEAQFLTMRTEYQLRIFEDQLVATLKVLTHRNASSSEGGTTTKSGAAAAADSNAQALVEVPLNISAHV